MADGEGDDPVADENPVEEAVTKEPVVFKALHERIKGDGPIVLVLLDDPPNPKVEQLVTDFLTAFFARPVDICAEPCVTAGIPPRPPKVKDLVQHIRKAVRDDAACAIGITQRAFIDEVAYGEAPGSPFARVVGGVALICTLMLGDRYDWSETFNFEKRFGKFSEHKCTKTKYKSALRVADWQREETTPVEGRQVEDEKVKSQHRRFLRRVITLATHTTARLLGLSVPPYDADMPLWIGADADAKILSGHDRNTLKTAPRPLTLNAVLSRWDALTAVLQKVNRETGSFRVGHRRYSEFDAEIRWLERAKEDLEKRFTEAATRAKWPDATADLPRVYGFRVNSLPDSPAFANVVMEGLQLCYHAPVSLEKKLELKSLGGMPLGPEADRHNLTSRTCLMDMQSMGAHHVELVSRRARECFLAEPSPQYSTNSHMAHYFA
jgi:hypothetical protein